MQTELTRHLAIYPQRCLNSRSADEFCRICVDVCPERAIDIVADDIRFDASQCHECALCVTDCPTGAYTHAAFSPAALMASAEGNEAVDLHCQFSGKAPAGQGGLLIPCHGLLNDRLLAGLHAAGVRELRLYGLDQCEACPSRVGAKRLSRTLGEAAPGLAGNFPVVEEMPDTVAGEPSGQKMVKPEAAVGRRGFLGRMARSAAYVAISTLPGSLQAADARHVSSGQQGLMAKHLPDMQRLALDLQARGVTGASWFYQLTANEECDLCNICSFGCPTGSFSIDESGQGRRLLHRPAACVGCGLCLSLCPQQALQFSQVDQQILRQDGMITLIELGQERCNSCGHAFTGSGAGTQLCPSCEKERAIRDQWLNM